MQRLSRKRREGLSLSDKTARESAGARVQRMLIRQGYLREGSSDISWDRVRSKGSAKAFRSSSKPYC